jgi:outer membrane protein assembly factor BamB
LLLAAGLPFLAAFEVTAQNWPQWRGPSSAGVSSESGLPTRWSAGENVAWKASLAGLGASSPIVWGDQVFVTSQIGDAPVAAGPHPQLARDDRSLAERENPLGGRRSDPRRPGDIWLVDELLVNSSERIDVYDPVTGTLLWHAGSPRQTPIPSAVFHDGRIYMSRGYRNSDYMAIRPGGRGDVTKTHIEWQAPAGASYVSSIVYYEGLLYMTNEVGVVTCADAKTGGHLWRQRLGGVFFASPVAGDGKIYMVSETGDTFVLRAGRKPQVLAQNDLGERFVASPAISNQRLFFRSDRTLFSVGQSERPARERP